MDLESQTILTNIIRGMVLNSGTNEFDIIIIGGGATGAGTARDCSLRGMRVLLVERFDFAAGATGRNHGLLHSGARYAVTDRESAAECIKENMILRKIARHCVEENGGFHDIVGSEAGGGEDGLYVGQRLRSLRLDAFGYETCCGVDGNLTGCVDESARVDGLAVRSDGAGGGGGAYCFFHSAYVVG